MKRLKAMMSRWTPEQENDALDRYEKAWEGYCRAAQDLGEKMTGEEEVAAQEAWSTDLPIAIAYIKELRSAARAHLETCKVHAPPVLAEIHSAMTLWQLVKDWDDGDLNR